MTSSLLYWVLLNVKYRTSESEKFSQYTRLKWNADYEIFNTLLQRNALLHLDWKYILLAVKVAPWVSPLELSLQLCAMFKKFFFSSVLMRSNSRRYHWILKVFLQLKNQWPSRNHVRVFSIYVSFFVVSCQKTLLNKTHDRKRISKFNQILWFYIHFWLLQG